jgi:hypothetical protein
MEQLLSDSLALVAWQDVELVDPADTVLFGSGHGGNNVSMQFHDMDVATRYELLRHPATHFGGGVRGGRKGEKCAARLNKDFGDRRGVGRCG